MDSKILNLALLCKNKSISKTGSYHVFNIIERHIQDEKITSPPGRKNYLHNCSFNLSHQYKKK